MRKQFVGKVNALEVKSFMMDALTDFYSYLTNIARFAIVDCLDKKPYTDIVKNEEFRVNVGDFMADTEPVFIEDNKKDAKTLIESFSIGLNCEFSYNDYSGLDFSGCLFPFSDFCYTQFRNSMMNNASFEASSIIGANFRKACMEYCCFSSCAINEADFSYSILKNASFNSARGRAGLPDEEEWEHVSFLPVNFRYADLTNVDFKWADLTGADFTGAILDGADFTGAILDGAIFTDAKLDNAIIYNK